jgi:outer membrane protein OmpA-like peptidoglycan-associated protein
MGATVLGGAESDDFSVSADTCRDATIAPAGTCTVSVAFAPASAGLKNAQISWTTNASGSPHVVPLSGTGTQASLVTDVDTLAFGDQTVDSQSPTRSVTLRNAGTAAVDLGGTAVALRGAQSDQFLLRADACSGATLPPEGSCAVGVAFSPTAQGAKDAELQFAAKNTAGTLTVRLSGDGAPKRDTTRPKKPKWATYKLLQKKQWQGNQISERMPDQSYTAQALRLTQRTVVRWGKSRGAKKYKVRVDGRTKCVVGKKRRECVLDTAVGSRKRVVVKAVGKSRSVNKRAKYVATSPEMVAKLHFAGGSAELSRNASRKTRQYARALGRAGFTEVIIRGYTASSGNPANAGFRKRLSRQRAQAVAHSMQREWKRMGIRVRVELQARAGKDPVGDNSTMTGQIKNQRATINIR